MSKNRKNKAQKPEIEKQSEYYRLKTEAVNDLVTANEENSPEVSEEELRAYRSGPKLKVADWVKMLFIKFWFAAAVCYFFLWGLGGFVSSMLDLLFITGFALGVVTDLLTNPVLRFFEKFGYDRFFFGTDYPLGDIPTELRRFFELNLPEPQQEMILWRNFARLFSLSED